MPRLLVKPTRPDPDGAIHRITPASAGWKYVGFEVFSLVTGQVVAQETAGREACLVLLSGRAEVIAGASCFGTIGERNTVFEGAPWSVYVPARSDLRVDAKTNLELAVCSSPATGRLPARLIPPADVGMETRGKGTNTRFVRNILPDTAPIAETCWWSK